MEPGIRTAGGDLAIQAEQVEGGGQWGLDLAIQPEQTDGCGPVVGRL